ncbi:hypothetical protein [Saccharopolyspora phatthalungensis]|uniref:Uncharacterized protein n=1 Tax=Saccharopolyspora phatthalungensis TaxID=664693 RepID=A0A840Q9C2_9PSEU|nr:hypothetical protein [Saccharopolyspora phatthalungensis]MBB5159142.1 hypothetical protein [Saccharopolyspora phatthalungensis]
MLAAAVALGLSGAASAAAVDSLTPQATQFAASGGGGNHGNPGGGGNHGNPGGGGNHGNPGGGGNHGNPGGASNESGGGNGTDLGDNPVDTAPTGASFWQDFL